MADPVQARSVSSASYREPELLECKEQVRTSSGAPRDGISGDRTPRSPAVDKLVKSQTPRMALPAQSQAPDQPSDCGVKVVEAAATCTAAVVWILGTGVTGGLAIAGALAAGAGCGVKTVQAYDHCGDP